MSDEVENNPEVIKSSPENRVEVSADLLNEAVTQLRKLTELRQREAERQERAIAQMQKSIKRQGILSRYVILTSTLAVLISVGLAYLIRNSVRNEAVTSSTLSQFNESVTGATRTIDDMRAEVSASRDTQSSMIKKVEEQLGAVREERDQVRGEVRNVLEEKTREFADKELALAEEREAIVEATKRSKEEQKALIQQTIERLAAMSASLTPEEEASANQPSDSEIEEAVSEAEEIVESTESTSDAIVEVTPEAPVEPQNLEQAEPVAEEAP
jgi:hypothetical protein